MTGPPITGEPAWVTDPTGRHQLRWWDGTRFSDQVADGGVRATDPFVGGTMPPITPLPPVVPTTKASRLPVILAAVGAFVVVLALLTLLADDDGGTSGTGRFTGEVGAEDDEVRHRFAITAGTALLVTVEPERDLDVVVGFAVGDDAAEQLADLYEGTAIDRLAREEDRLVFRRDIGFEGEDERTFLAAPFDVEGDVVVSGFEGSEGEYEIRIEAIDLDVDDAADGEDMLAALDDADGLPRAFRELLDGLLG